MVEYILYIVAWHNPTIFILHILTYDFLGILLKEVALDNILYIYTL